MSLAVKVQSGREAAIAVDRPRGPDAHLAEIAPRPLGGFSVDNPTVENFIFLTDVENECEHGAVPMDALKGRAECTCHDNFKPEWQRRGPARPAQPTPDLMSVFHKMPLMLEPPKEEEAIVTTAEKIVENAAAEAAQERSTCAKCLARTYRGEECVCDEPDAEDYDDALDDERSTVEPLPAFVQGLLDELDAEIERLQSARERLTAALA